MNEVILSKADEYALVKLDAKGQTLLESWKVLKQDVEQTEGKLRSIVRFIVENQISNEVVSLTCRAAGFPEPRISEYKRLSFGDPETRTKFIEGDLTWRFALAESRQKAAAAKPPSKRKKRTAKVSTQPIWTAFAKFSKKGTSKGQIMTCNKNLLVLVTGEFTGTMTSPDGILYAVTIQKGEVKTNKQNK